LAKTGSVKTCCNQAGFIVKKIFMQISRHLLLTCAVAACLTPTLVHAADNEAQIRARQALEEKMNQMPAATNPPPAVSKPKAAAAKPAPAPKPAPPVVTVTPKSTTVEGQPAQSATIHAATPSTDSATQQKLEEALHQAQPQPVAPQPTPVVPQPAPVVEQPPMQQPAPVVQQPAAVAPKTPAVESQPAPTTPSYISTPSNDDATNQKLQEALRQKMQQTPVETAPPAIATQKPANTMKPAPTGNYAPQPAPQPAPTANYAPVPTTSTPHPNLPEQPTPQAAPAPVVSKNQPPAQPTVSLPALQAPATGLSPAKQQKLDELLNQYRADQITPQQYHEQRAKILAEP
jgi:hypothetical protein